MCQCCCQGYKQRDAFIITQMPVPDTIIGFWAMCFDHNCKTIIMMNPTDAEDEVSEAVISRAIAVVYRALFNEAANLINAMHIH